MRNGGSPRRHRFSPAKLRACREAAGLSRELLAGLAGVAYGTVEAAERANGTSPSLDTFIALLDVLDAEPSELLEPIPEDER